MTDPISLVRVITWLPVGGIERRLVSVLPRLRERGYEPRLICVRELGPLAAELEDSGVPVHLCAMRSRLDPRGLSRLAALMREHRAQVVHSHMYRSNVPATIAARRAGVPVVFGQVHNVGTWESGRQRALDRFLCRWRTGMICVSRAVQEDVCAALDLPPGRAPILYNGCDIDRFHPDAPLREATRASLGISPSDTLLLVPARLHANKCPLDVLRVFASVASEPGMGDARLAFAGDGPLREELAAAHAASGLGGRVLLLGRRDDMPALYNAADAVLLSSLKEGFSNAVVEALACGKPVVAADVGGNREALDDNPDHGWIHRAADWDALAAQLREALGNRWALAARSAACRARGEFFSLDSLVGQTDALYRAALGASPR